MAFQSYGDAVEVNATDIHVKLLCIKLIIVFSSSLRKHYNNQWRIQGRPPPPLFLDQTET